MSRRNPVLCILLFAAVVFLSGGHGQLLLSFLSLTALSLFCAMALPVSQILFPDKIYARLFAAPIGFVVHAFFLSLAGRFFGVHAWVLAVYAVIAAVLFYILRKARQPLTENPEWDEADTFLLLAWMLLTVLLVALPFWNVGVLTENGFAYRAYFNADFFRNMSVSGALNSTGIPPDNPYVGGYVLSYYWFFHILPSFWQQAFPAYRPDFLMVQFSLFSLCLFVTCLFAAIKKFTVRRRTLVWMYPVFAFGGSYEGLFILKKLSERHMHWTSFTEWNVDGILRWMWNAPQIDALYRALLYAPQHLLALCMALMLLCAWSRDLTFTRKLLLLALVFSSVGFSAFVGAALVILAAFLMLSELRFEPKKQIVPIISGGILGLLFLALYLRLFEMFQASGGLLVFGADAQIMNHFVAYFVLNWGALLPLGILGIVFYGSRVPLKTLLFLLALCFFLIIFVKLNLPGGSDVSLKMGHFSHVILLLLAAGFLDRLFEGGRTGAALLLVGLLVAPASLTWWMDATNSRDISNQKFTTFVQPQDMKVYEWMRSHLSGQARIQNYARSETSFLRGFVSEIPTFAQRSLFLGDRNFSRIFQVPPQDVEQRRRIVSQLISENSPQRLWQRSRDLGIEYYYWGSHDSVSLPEARTILIEPYFSIVAQEENAFLFRVNPMQQ